MPDPPAIGVYVFAALALLIVPGPSVLYIVTRSIDQGQRAGLVSVLGIHVGTLVHIFAAAAGLSALVLASATAFSAVKYAGAVYLIELGLWTLLSRRAEPDVALGGERNLRRAFSQGVIVNVLNPKTALFFLAFLPQFVDPNAPHPAVQIAFSGCFSCFSVLSPTRSGRSPPAPPAGGSDGRALPASAALDLGHALHRPRRGDRVRRLRRGLASAVDRDGKLECQLRTRRHLRLEALHDLERSGRRREQPPLDLLRGVEPEQLLLELLRKAATA